MSEVAIALPIGTPVITLFTRCHGPVSAKGYFLYYGFAFFRVSAFGASIAKTLFVRVIRIIATIA
jgi:hypothetical protein